jgi:hypothetical protein
MIPVLPPLPPDWNEQGDKSWLAADDPRRYINGGRRCALTASGWLDNWWMGTSPRNGDNAGVEGPWEDWVRLARNILAAHERAVAQGLCAEVPAENEVVT